MENLVREVVIHSGNILNSSTLKKKMGYLTPSDEIVDSLKETLTKAQSSNIKMSNELAEVEPPNDIYGRNSILKAEEGRKNLKVIVKIFLTSYSVKCVEGALEKVLNNLNSIIGGPVSYVESLVLSPPGKDSKFNLDDLKPIWQKLEDYFDKEQILCLGISDIDINGLKLLHSWAKVKPKIVNINLDSCCVVPPEMQSFAKENDIQILTHNDPSDIFSNMTMRSLLRDRPHQFLQPDSWHVNWVSRYVIMIKCRGVVQNKGYFVSLKHSLS